VALVVGMAMQTIKGWRLEEPGNRAIRMEMRRKWMFH